MSERRLAGKVAVVTGAAGAIGRAEAMALAASGARVVLNDIADLEPVSAAIKAIGGEAVSVEADIAKEGAEVIAAALKAFGRLDILINNAGIGRRAEIDKASDADWDDVLAVNLKAAFATIRAAAPVFRAQASGVIVNTSSDAGTGTYGFASYAASKEGVVGLTRAVAWELGRAGVVTFAIRPRAFDGALTPPGKHQAFKDFETRAGAPLVGVHPWSRTIFPSAEEVGDVVAWLCAEAPANLNGRVVQVGGGEIGLWEEPRVARSFQGEAAWDAQSLDAIKADLFEDLTDPRAAFSEEIWSEISTREIHKPLRKC